jgi:hypothetical protein
MIEAEPSTEIPIAKVNLILRIGRRLGIPTVVREAELLLCARIESRGIRNGVLQALPNGIED